jgi:SOS-response transcriptional repressor LexA
MIEPEIAFADLNDNMQLAWDMIKAIINHVLETCPQEIEFFNNFVEKGLIDRLTALVNSEYKRVTVLTRKPKPRMYKIDWFTLPASAGTGNILDSELAEELLVPESAEAEQADFVISVGGDSMEPTYHDGDKVFVEKCDSVDIGEVGIFVVNGDVYIKELGNKCLISHNEKYKPIRIGENDSIYCCGRVVGIVED